MRAEELIKKMEEEYPNVATELIGKSNVEIEVYLGQLTMIEHMKLIVDPKPKRKG